VRRCSPARTSVERGVPAASLRSDPRAARRHRPAKGISRSFAVSVGRRTRTTRRLTRSVAAREWR